MNISSKERGCIDIGLLMIQLDTLVSLYITLMIISNGVIESKIV